MCAGFRLRGCPVGVTHVQQDAEQVRKEIYSSRPLDDWGFILYSNPMKYMVSVAILFAALALISVESRASEPFDSEEPFNQAVTKNLLRSFLNQALDVLDDHLEITGSLNPDEKQGDQLNRLKFRFYPEGKSKSDESVTAEGWIDRAPHSNQQDLHFRFSLPKPTPRQAPAESMNVL
jgi:hypothetical protein